MILDIEPPFIMLRHFSKERKTEVRWSVQNWFSEKSSFGYRSCTMYFILDAAMVVKVVLRLWQPIRQGELQKCQNWPSIEAAKPSRKMLFYWQRGHGDNKNGNSNSGILKGL